LAIELAASRTAALSVEDLATRLDDRFRLLTGGRRTALPRHQTLRATFDWSYGLLSEPERALLRRIAIFAGFFELSAAIAVASDPEIAPSNVLDDLANLVAKSLVVAEVDGAAARYRLLDTTRAYGLEKMDESGERAKLARRHAEFFRNLFERAEAEWNSRPATEWLSDYGRHIDNVRAAIEWAFSADGDAPLGAALTAGAVPLWMHLSMLDECRGRVQRALIAAEGNSHLEMRLHAALGASLAWVGFAGLDIRAAWTRALRLAEQLNDVDHQLRALWGLWIVQDRRSLKLAREFSALAVAPADRLMGGRMIGVSCYYLGMHEAARRSLERVISNDGADPSGSRIVRFQIDETLAARGFLARTLWVQGLPEQATHMAASLVADARAIDHAHSVCHAIAMAGCPIALWVGDLELAEQHLGLMEDYAKRYSLGLWDVYCSLYRGALAIKRGDLQSGLPLLRVSLDKFTTAFPGRRALGFLCELAENLGRAGRTSEGLATIEEATRRALRTTECWLFPELRRIKGNRLSGTQVQKLRKPRKYVSGKRSVFLRGNLLFPGSSALRSVWPSCCGSRACLPMPLLACGRSTASFGRVLTATMRQRPERCWKCFQTLSGIAAPKLSLCTAKLVKLFSALA
jgi:predicted ATPase